MTIWADADSLPREVKNYIARRSRQQRDSSHEILAVFVSGKKLPVPDGRNIKAVIAEGGEDAADTYILQHIQTGDIAVTRDIPFAEKLVERGNTALNDRGQIWNTDTIRERLSLRNAALELRQLGIAESVERKRSFGQKEARAFAAALDRAIQILGK